MHFRAGRVFAIDSIPSRLEMARAQGAEVIDFNAEDPVEVIHQLTGGIGVDRAIDAVGVDATSPHSGPAATKSEQEIEKNRRQVDQSAAQKAPESRTDGGHWVPGDAPAQVFEWVMKGIAKAGTFSIIGVYPQTTRTFPIGAAMMKNLTLRMGNCNHRKYIPLLIELVSSGVFDPSTILTQAEPLTTAIDAYKAFDERQPGWVKVELLPAA
jgi:threonine dehydrogenase-like Zn-dependent dehydrogenase